MIRRHKIYFLIIGLLFITLNSYGQYSSEEELKEAAADFFDNENFVEALPLYSQLLSLYPKDPNYNYRYGASSLYGSVKKEEAVTYLKFSVSKPSVEPLAYYYLAKAYHYNYNFKAAIVYYNKFKDKTDSKVYEKYETDRQIEMCENGQKLLKSMTNIGVVSKKEIKSSDFFRSYNLKGIGGKIIVKPDEFKTKTDKKKNENSIIHADPSKKMIIFSSYGKKGDNGKDIFKVTQLESGEWSEPISLGPSINSKYDEDYPFLHPDGKTLYFSSKGYNSMGGYDIFRSTLNSSTNEWSTPENIDFPINTPYDDILYVTDIDNKLAYFASSRASKQGEITVYKVKVEPEPEQNAVINGTFIAESNPAIKSATITIMDVEKDEKYGVYTTDNKSGDYLLLFPENGGKFKLLIETSEDAPIHSAIIDVPKVGGPQALKQELILVGEGEEQKLVVKNLFDEVDEFDISNPLIVANLLKKRAKLDVNTSEEEVYASGEGSNTSGSDPDLTLQNAIDNELPEKSKYDDLSDDQMVTITNEKTTRLIAKAKESRNQSNTSYRLADEKSKEAKRIYKETPEDKNAVAEAANEAFVALNIARTTESEASERESDIEKIEELKEQITTQLSEGNRKEAEASFIKLNELSEATYQKESALDKETELATNRLKTKEAELNKNRNLVTELTSREIEINDEISELKSTLENTRKKSEKENITDQINVKNIDLEDIKYDLDKEKTKGVAVKNAFAKAKNELKLVQDVTQDINAPSNATVSELEVSSKLRLDNDISYFEEEGILGLYPSLSDEDLTASLDGDDIEKNENEVYNLIDHKDEYEIIDDEGNIIDYNTNFGSSLVDADNVEDETQKAELIAEVNKEWIQSIDQEIEITENQLKVESGNTEKSTLENRLQVLKGLKSEKERELEEQLAFVESTNADNTEETGVDIPNIINENGDVIDYNTQFEEELAVLRDKETAEAYNEKSAIHKKWGDAIEQELLLKKVELSESNQEEKPEIEQEVAQLEEKLQENRGFEESYKNQAIALGDNTSLVATNEGSESDNTLSTIEGENGLIEDETESINSLINEEDGQIDLSQFDTSVVKADGSITTYSSILRNEIISANSINNEYDKNVKKAEITEQLITSIDEEIKYRNEEVKYATEEEKEQLNNTLNELTADKADQETKLNEYQEAINSEKAKEEEAILTVNNLDAPEDEFSSLKYNNRYEYKSSLSSNDIAGVEALKLNAAELLDEAEIKKNSIADLASNEEKQAVLAEAEELTYQSEIKQVEIAKKYEIANAIEFKNNEQLLSKIKALNDDEYSEEAVLMDLFSDESKTYNQQAKEAREDAENAPNFTSKSIALQKAYELEMKAIEKQNKAIEASPRSDVSDLYTRIETENKASNEALLAGNAQSLVNNDQTIDNEVDSDDVETIVNENETSEEDLTTDNTGLPNDANQTGIDNQDAETSTDESGNTNQTLLANNIYEPRSIDLPSTIEIEKAKRLEKEAEVLNIQAQELRDSAEVVRKKKVKEALNLQVDELVEQANQKTKEAQVFYSNAESMKQGEGVLVTNLAENRENLRKETLSPEDIEIVNGLEEGELSEIKNADDYISYAGFKKEARRLIKAAEVQYIEADELQEEIEADEALKAQLVGTLDKADTQEEKVQIETQITEIDAAIEDKRTREKQLREQATDKEKDAEVVLNKAEFLISVADTETANNYRSIEKTDAYGTDDSIALIEAVETVNGQENEIDETSDNENTLEEENVGSEDENENVLVTNIETESIDEVPEVLNESIFVITANDQASYNEEKKIPSVKLPEGLVFKVQIGAFRNQIPQDHFRGFAPIMAEDAGNGITRYTAGFFKGFNAANEAKNSIRDIGYSDAFVVAFFNGKRIDINKARAMISGNDVDNQITLANNNVNGTSLNNNQQSTNNTDGSDESIDQTLNSNQGGTGTQTGNTASQTESTNNNDIEIEEVVDGISTDVRNIDGVFYTVQVGVFSRPVSPGELNNIDALNSERTASGLIRYTTGIYKNITEASSAKDAVIDLGISDAFVVAYQNGVKISVTKANELLGQNTPTEPVLDPVVEPTIEPIVEPVVIPVIEPTTEPVVEPIDADEITTIDNEDPIDNIESIDSLVVDTVNIEFRIKLGEYEDEVPVRDAAIFLQLTSRGVASYTEENKTIYTIGSFTTYEEALDMQSEMEKIGIEDPDVLTFKDGISLPLQEALELLKK